MVQLFPVGYKLANPFTGHNYGYYSLVPQGRRQSADRTYKSNTINGMLWMVTQIMFTLIYATKKHLLVWLGPAVIVTECLGWYYTQDVVKLVNDDDYFESRAVSSGFQQMIANDFGGDAQGYREAMRHILYTDRVNITQGSSIVYSVGAAFVFFCTLFWLMKILATWRSLKRKTQNMNS